METILEHQDGLVRVEPDPGGGRSQISVTLTNPDLYCPNSSCESGYPVALIEKILCCKGPAYLVDEILRDESPDYVELELRQGILGYISEEEARGKRFLDFGCGCGSSTMVLSRIFPDSDIVGVELERDFVDVARLRSEHHGNQDRVQLLLSPHANSLPQDLGQFDFIILSGVYEHLLPRERKQVLPQLWGCLEQGGMIFIDQTPYRWFPVETHTTSGLPLLNYLPAVLAGPYARRFSKRKLADCDWETLLRKGIRGGSESEILRLLAGEAVPSEGGAAVTPISLQPSRDGLKGHIDLWYRTSTRRSQQPLKKALYRVLKAFRAVSGVSVVPGLSLAIAKGTRGSSGGASVSDRHRNDDPALPPRPTRSSSSRRPGPRSSAPPSARAARLAYGHQVSHHPVQPNQPITLVSDRLEPYCNKCLWGMSPYVDTSKEKVFRSAQSRTEQLFHFDCDC